VGESERKRCLYPYRRVERGAGGGALKEERQLSGRGNQRGGGRRRGNPEMGIRQP